MSNLVVITFDDAEEAGKVRDALRSAEGADYLSLDDSAIVVKDEKGKVHVKNELDRGVKIGAVGGGALGLLIGSIFFPLTGLLVGALAGGLLGSAAELGIPKKFVQEVSEDLTPGTSALFIIVRDANPNVALAALKPYKGIVRHTSLSPDAEQELRRVLSKKI